MSLRDVFKKVATEWWAAVRAHEDPAQPYLDKLDRLSHLSDEETLVVLQQIQGDLDSGVIPSPSEYDIMLAATAASDDLTQTEKASISEALIKARTTVELLISRLAAAMSEYSQDYRHEGIAVTSPEGLASSFTDARELIAQANEALSYKVRQWEEEWLGIIDEELGAHGSPFFAEGGEPLLKVGRGVLATKTHGLYALIATTVRGMEGTLFDAETRPGISGEGITTLAREAVQKLYSDYTTKESLASSDMRAWLNTLDLFFGMLNWKNIWNQYMVGSIFLFIGKAVGKPITWLARVLKPGPPATYKTVARLSNMQKLAVKLRQPEMFAGYRTKEIRALYESTPYVLKYGKPILPPASPVTGINPLEWGMIKKGTLPAEYVAGMEPEIAALLTKAQGVAGSSALIAIVGVELETHAERILARVTDPDALAMEAKQAVETGTETLESFGEKWVAAHAAELEEATISEAVEIAERVQEETPIPTLERAEQDEGAALEALHEVWARQVLSYYEGIGRVQDYGVAVSLLAEMAAMGSGAMTDEDTAWLNGLILAIENYLLQWAHEMGDYSDLGVRRAKDAFETPMELNL